MTDSNLAFETELQRLIELRDGAQVVARLVHDDPKSRFALAFNREMESVDAEYIDRVYLLPQAALSTRVCDGRVESATQLLRLMIAVLVRTGFHYRVLSYHKANPRIRRGQPSDRRAEKPDKPLPLFVRDCIDQDQLRDPKLDPSAAAERADLLRIHLRIARGLGRLRLRVLRTVRQFAMENGSEYGAFRMVGQLAVLDQLGQVVNIHSAHKLTPATEPVSKQIVYQVRKLYVEAIEYLSRCGYSGSKNYG
jgi:hypothetical protein